MNNESLHIRDLGSFFVGGREYEISGQPPFETTIAKGCKPSLLDPNGQFEAGQMYVQFMHHEKPQARYPLAFIHGGGMTGACWETTPDGRPAMHNYFLRRGHNTYVCDGVERGRASQPSTRISTTVTRSFVPSSRRGKASALAPTTRLAKFGPASSSRSTRSTLL